MQDIRVTCRAADSLPIDRLMEFQGSLKRISPGNLAKLKARILKHGINAPVFVWDYKGDYYLLDGHQRIKALCSLREEGYDMPLIPVAYIEAENISDAKDKLLGISSQYGEFVLEGFAEFTADLTLDADLRLVDGEFLTPKPEREATEGDDEVPEEAPAITAPGDLWELGGGHRVLCGDARISEHIDTLMDGKQAEMVWTDPPYGVAIGDKNKMLNAIGRSNRIEKNLENDTLNEDGLTDMLRSSFTSAAAHCTAGAAWYVAAPAGPLHVLFGSELKRLGIWRQTLQWVKNNATFSPMGVDYHWRAEPIFYGWIPGAGHRYYGGRKQDTVWEIDRPTKSAEHPTMKPVALVARAIENSSRSGDIVLDMFLGSGTTLIASEQLGRVCYGTEIDKHYCDVIVRRYVQWCEANGREVVVKRNGETFDLAAFREAS